MILWYDYVKPKYGKNVKRFYMDTDSFIVHVKRNDIYKYIAKDVETRFDKSNFEIDKPLPKGQSKWSNKRWIVWANNERICRITSQSK